MDNLLTIVNRNNQLPGATLDFDALREEGTAYIAQLGHKLWSDYNSHDPGITILEVLCFAINDLSYRTSLPIEDILTGPESDDPLKQFYTAAEILTCCPVTPMDFRKLLIDCRGVKNAWVFRAGETDQFYYQDYYFNKNPESVTVLGILLQDLYDSLTATGEEAFPVTSSKANFIEALGLEELLPSIVERLIIEDGKKEVEELKQMLESGDLPAKIISYGSFLFDLLSQKVKPYKLREDLARISVILSIINDTDFLENGSGPDTYDIINEIIEYLNDRGYMPADFNAQLLLFTELFNKGAITDDNKTVFNDLVNAVLSLDFNFSTLEGNLETNLDELGIPENDQDLIKNFLIDFINGTGSIPLENPRNETEKLLSITNIIIANPNLIELDTSQTSEDFEKNLRDLLESTGNNRIDPDSYNPQIEHFVDYIEELTLIKIHSIAEFLNRILNTDDSLVITDWDFENLLYSHTKAIIEEEVHETARRLVVGDSANASVLRSDLDRFRKFYEIIDLEELKFDPLDKEDEIRNKIIDFITSSSDIPDFLMDESLRNQEIDRFLRAFSCGQDINKFKSLNVNVPDTGTNTGIFCLIDRLIEIQIYIQGNDEFGLVFFTILNSLLLELIESCDLITHKKQIQVLLIDATLPGYYLRRREEIPVWAMFFQELGQIIQTKGKVFESPALNFDLDICKPLNSIIANLDTNISSDRIDTSILLDHFISLCISWRVTFCGDPDLTQAANYAPLNGLYTVCLDLEDAINPLDTLLVNSIKEDVLHKLTEYRNLGEDFLSIDLVGEKPVCIDLDIVAGENVDVNEIEAKVIFKIQQFFSSSPNFYSLQELLDKGFTCNQIYQGVLLENGFLLDEEVETAKLRRVIYKSDLYQVIMSVLGVEAIKCLDIELCSPSDQACPYNNDWCLDICQHEQYQADLAAQEASGSDVLELYAAPVTCKFKPILDIEKSDICIQQGETKILTIPQEVNEKLALIRQLDRKPAIVDALDNPIPKGTYRGLNEYESIQEDFPLVYRIGKDQVPDNFPAQRKALVKQLKGYLTFFDQLLANYLAQLGNVKEVLSVSPSLKDRVLTVKSLRGLDPGIDELLQEFVQLNDHLYQELQGILDTTVPEGLSSMKNQPPLPKQIFLKRLAKVLGGIELDHEIIQAVENFGKVDDYYETQLAEIVENELERNKRRNRVLDHLIARFGEHFTDYALSIYKADPDEPCKAPRIKIQDNLLHCKTDFLKSIPMIGKERGKGLNYKAEDCIRKEKFWSTENVAGMHKRVSKILCIPPYEYVQINERFRQELNAILDETQSESIDGLKDKTLYPKPKFLKTLTKILQEDKLSPEIIRIIETYGTVRDNFRIQLSCPPKVDVGKKFTADRKSFTFAVKDEGKDPSNPDTKNYLIGVREFTARAKGKKVLDKICDSLLKPNQIIEGEGIANNYLDVVLEGEKYYVHLFDSKGMLLAQSISFDTIEDAGSFRESLIDRIFSEDCQTEGFHVVEHILLRPFTKEMEILNPICLSEDCVINDPYSFWITVVALDTWERFSIENGARAFFESTVRRETPAHIGINFLWLNVEEMYRFEIAYKNWLYDIARIGADDCQIEESLSKMVVIMNELLAKLCKPQDESLASGCQCS